MSQPTPPPWTTPPPPSDEVLDNAEPDAAPWLVAALRTLKSDVITGLAPNTLTELEATGGAGEPAAHTPLFKHLAEGMAERGALEPEALRDLKDIGRLFGEMSELPMRPGARYELWPAGSSSPG
ncbi:hypothetical protein [Streptomyces sp.]|uniref:hypothetical protein n=1 Tax=Streptomyces sp. TaxID=1931 RepID=UPI002D76EECE|nr:hypothetical protein [Streptomyces sp.]HET6354690.1 hypothetical protein [Streptomyces sp.]